jgi:hypothetical protein
MVTKRMDSCDPSFVVVVWFFSAIISFSVGFFVGLGTAAREQPSPKTPAVLSEKFPIAEYNQGRATKREEATRRLLLQMDKKLLTNGRADEYIDVHDDLDMVRLDLVHQRYKNHFHVTVDGRKIRLVRHKGGSSVIERAMNVS